MIQEHQKMVRGDLDDEVATKDSESWSDKKKETKAKLVVPISEKKRIPKISINTQKVTNEPSFISL